MENKKYIIILFSIICVCFLLVGYFNFEKIVSFFNNKEWEFAESFATINEENVSNVEGGKQLVILANNHIDLYGNKGKSEFNEEIISSNFMSSSCDSYLVLVPKDTKLIYLFRGSELVWKNEFKWNILNVSVNKNGYVTVIYSQSGYKSSIKIFKPTGEELFTTYLASTYALDVEMSNDNKYLYVAEIDTEGIKIESNIKIIEITNFEPGMNETNNVETVLVGTDTLITDIEYSDSNQLYILKDSGIDTLSKDKIITNLGTFEVKNILFSRIYNLKYPITIEKNSTGIFTNEIYLKIFKEEVINIKIDRTPQNIDTLEDKIALNLGNEVLFLNTNGKVEKRYELEKQLLSVKLYDSGNLAALVFRDKIELVKL